MTIETQVQQAIGQEKVTISLRYEGPEVENGSMALNNIISVLQGFTGIYGIIAKKNHPDAAHQLHISDIQPGSIDIILEAWQWIEENENTIQTTIIPLAAQSTIILSIIKEFFALATFKIHVANKNFEKHPSGAKQSNITNYNGDNMTVNNTTVNFIADGKTNHYLYQTVKMLREGRIDAAEFKATTSDGEEIKKRITAEERPSFEPQDIKMIITQRKDVVVTLNSLTKSTNNGHLYLTDGTRIPYSYKGDLPDKLYSIFGTDNKPILASCELHRDREFEITHADIYDVDPLQDPLFDYQ